MHKSSFKVPENIPSAILFPFLLNPQTIFLFVDNRFNIRWMYDRFSYDYPLFLEYLDREGLRTIFSIPECPDANTLFDNPATAATFRVSAAAGEPGAGPTALGFWSRNEVEKKMSDHPFWTRLPYSRLYLSRLHPDCFLGRILFTRAYYEFETLKEQPILVVDNDSNIMSYNNRFETCLGPDIAPQALIGRSLESILTFPRKAGENTDPPESLPAVVDWKAGAPFPFKNEGSGEFSAQRRADGLFLENRDDLAYAYLTFRSPVPVDRRWLVIDLETVPGTLMHPNLIVQGSPYRAGYMFDTQGYSYCTRPGPGRLVIKRQADSVFSLGLSEMDRDKPLRLRFIRSPDGVHAIHVNDRLTARFDVEPAPPGPGTDRFYLFLRPGESVLLRRLKVAVSPEPLPGTGPTKVTAILAGRGRESVFNVVSRRQMVGDVNCRILILEDITELSKSLNVLQDQRDRLIQMVRQDDPLTGISAGIRAIRSVLPAVARSALSILIEGETGTGKDILARALHAASPRTDKPFVKLDCAALPEGLLESELFGHVKGAFTGAVADHTGRFEQAQGGTLFLDEIGNLPPRLQAKLLNVLQDLKVQRLGALKAIDLDVRIVTATNAPLLRLIAEGRFREDLYYRINQYCFRLPPLRDRREDIPILADVFVKEANLFYGKVVRGLDPAALTRLSRDSWRGNIREFRNAIFRAMLFSKGDQIQAVDLDQGNESLKDAASAGPPARGGHQRRFEISREEFETELRASRGQVALLARKLKISRLLVYKLLKRHGLTVSDYRKI